MARRYAIILGNLGNTCDRFCSGYKQKVETMAMLEQASRIRHIEGIELVGTWDIRPDNAPAMKKTLAEMGLACASIIPDLFADRKWGRGSFCAADQSVRRDSVAYTRQMCDIARDLGCRTLNLWPGQDG